MRKNLMKTLQNLNKKKIISNRDSVEIIKKNNNINLSFPNRNINISDKRIKIDNYCKILIDKEIFEIHLDNDIKIGLDKQGIFAIIDKHILHINEDIKIE